jgi:hypothetical protein
VSIRSRHEWTSIHLTIDRRDVDFWILDEIREQQSIDEGEIRFDLSLRARIMHRL